MEVQSTHWNSLVGLSSMFLKFDVYFDWNVGFGGFSSNPPPQRRILRIPPPFVKVSAILLCSMQVLPLAFVLFE
jgi:hypothetical protein